ncbi:acetyl-CoA hydrolase/transferase family protein [Sedimentibacter hydroxybenzoicus DSM 7310]|uniref:Acetyl-CoA hydrolase/transferase family protein n=1 Tax=Sedimentibacter hydroxybenzoicus DSM 7310 TaxID=1123245 RepID=A0A974GXK6_SEDHY|nr:acetyl-CoA hydrolase/transferase family protein [Sedimentibacter hydroxybenzoicus]NYB75697.1 acetyl-CoA hydrolase/transferase family protein [Sedimentibacter hydroxybenzoicus DSM 7310]
MDVNKIYNNKLITVEEALSKIKSNDSIVSGMAAAEGREFLKNLHTIAGAVKDVNVTTCLPMGDYEYYMNPDYKDSFKMDGWFYSPAIRKAHKTGNISFIPNHLHLAAKKRLFHRKPNIYIGSGSLMDKHGYISLSLSATYERDIMENSDIVIIEINPNMPRTFGDTTVHINDIDYVIEVDYNVPALAEAEITEKDKKIGKYIADLIEDGSTIQLGIGGIPNAVAAELMNKKDLGVHTEMLTDGVVDLYNAGVITGKRKTLMPGKMVATFALGTQKLYNFINDNPAVSLMKGSWVNDPYVIGKNHKMVSINTSLEIDLTGQCCSESLGHIQFSGTGGQADTAIGAQMSRDGKSIIALYSTTKARVSGQADKQTVSKIVTRLAQGAAVSLSRNDVDYVVTEYGVASLRGTSIGDRVEALINIAHPDFRDQLKKEAEELKIW